MHQKRPEGVPVDAVWSHSDREWALGKKNDKGVSIGHWTWWREDGTVCCDTIYDGETGKDCSFSRFHQDGTFSWRGKRKNGQNHGVHEFQRSYNPTTESVNKHAEQFHPNVHSWKSFFDMGRPTRTAAFFDKDGNEISFKGVKKPSHLPDDASAVLDGTWRLEHSADGIVEKHNGQLSDWDEQGRLFKKSIIDVKALKRQSVFFYDVEGSLYCERNHVTGNGYILKPAHEVVGDPHVQNHFKGKTAKVTFKFRDDGSLGSEAFMHYDREFYDANGVQLTAAGEELVQPSANAKIISISDYEGTESFFYEAAFSDFKKREGLFTVWSGNGAKKYEAKFSSNYLVSLIVFNPDGALKTEEIFEPGVKSKGNKPMLQSFKIYQNKTTREFLYDEDGYNIKQNIYDGEKLIDTIDNQTLRAQLTVEQFANEFSLRYKDTDGFAHLAFNGYFDVRGNEVQCQELDHYFKCTILAGDGAGNELFMIREPGEFNGKIYDNDHETGLYTVEDSESVEDFLESEYDLDGVKIKNLNAMEVIRMLPFIVNETKVANNLNELLSSVYFCSLDTYRTEIDDFCKAIGERNGGTAR